MVSIATPRYITDEEVRAVFTLERAYDSQAEAFRSLESGRAHLGQRVLVPAEENGPFTFSYIARLHPEAGVVAKLGSVQPANAGTGLPVVSALITCLDPRTGAPVAIIDGTSVTTLRTAAATAVAIDALRRGRHHLRVAIIGAGVQGMAHLAAISRLDSVSRIDMVTRPERHELLQLPSTPHCEVQVSDSVTAAARRADVVVLCTNSATPVISVGDLKPNAVVISIGSYSAELSEVDGDVVSSAALVVVDHIATSLVQAGPVVQASAAGVISPDSIVELGAVITGRIVVPEGLIFFNSIGIGVQDSAAAWSIVAAITSKDHTK